LLFHPTSFDLPCDENFEKSNKNAHECCESYNLAIGGGTVAAMAIVASAFYSDNPNLITSEEHETIRISLPTANTPVTLIPKVPTKDLLNKETRNLV
jgi:hypothetical protein